MKSFISPYANVVIPAGESNVLDVVGRVFYCKESTDTFKMSYNDGSKFPMEVGLGFELEPGEQFTKLEFENPTDNDITVTFYAGNFKIYDSRSLNQVNSRAGASGVNSSFNQAVGIVPCASTAGKEIVAVSNPAGSIWSFAIPLLSPYRLAWIYYDYDNPVTLGQAHVQFYKDNVSVLSLPLIIAAGSQQRPGFGLNSDVDSAYSVQHDFTYFWPTYSGGGALQTVRRIHPMRLNVLADTIAITHNVNAGNLTALLACYSTDKPI